LPTLPLCVTQAIAEEVKKSGASGEVCPVRCDLRRESDIMDMFQTIRTKYGRLDVCINNAGLMWCQKKISEGDTEEWREMLDVSIFLSRVLARLKTKLMGIDVEYKNSLLI